ncbi:phospholipase D-like domain-containing protein [Ramlibacter sp. MMS24-I3-19]|uniref:phospholipase D-like domain-containing protein n=1 Tax=Ramlibacter sp. MMS24-I3-19 TaxID=3416606 RepID=UPI003D04DD35
MIRLSLLSLQRLLVLATAGCALLPARVDRIPSSVLKDTAQTRISRTVLPLTSARPQASGAYALFSARDAFAARWTLATNAERSLDVQYYIWRPDTSGSLMAHALREAAERGVRVRVLLDDANTSGLDEDIAAIAVHPNIQVRLFNPFANRSWRAGDLVGDFGRVNRRMHNKSFTADNRVTVVGGRNIGDEYLGAESRVAFSDLDLMVIGPVVDEVSAAFDAYWNSASAYPVGSLLPAPSAAALAEIEDKWARRRSDRMAADYLEAARKLSLVQRMRSGTLPLAWGPARVLSDDPAKVLGTSGGSDAGIQGDLRTAFGMPQRELLLVSPYFVPGQGGSALLAELAARGIRVTVLTNSLAATDVPATYAGYLRYRDLLLRAGVHVHELKPSAQAAVVAGGREDREDRGRGIGGSSGGSSTASLHAKTFVVDRQRVFVGSYNLDPRSARLNTEMGVVMDNPELAGQLADTFDAYIAQDAYELRLDGGGAVTWIERTASGEVRHASAPGTGTLRMWWIHLLGLLPIEWLL